MPVFASVAGAAAGGAAGSGGGELDSDPIKNPTVTSLKYFNNAHYTQNNL
jgi:hypothetical protein